MTKKATENVFTPEQIKEIIKCKSDYIYTIHNYVRIVHPTKGEIPFHLFDYQEELIDLYSNNRQSIVVMSRQMGKCCDRNTLIKVRNKKTGEIKTVTMEEFHELQK